jgi:hypothetical protein
MGPRILPFGLAAALFCATAFPAVASASDAEPDSARTSRDDGTTYLVPSLEDGGYRMSEGKKKFQHRISFSPGVGQLGNQDFFAFRAAYSPNTWLGYEISLGHNPAASLHALLHTFNVVLRYPMPWRLQPYGIVGYGMMTVYPGQAINADPVTKNTVTAGGGLEVYIRDDVAVRGEVLGATVFGQERDREGTVSYMYREYTIGFSFYRNLGN